MVNTCFVTEWVIGPLKSPEITFSIYAEKYTKNYQNPPNYRLSDLNYYRFHLITPIGSAFISLITFPPLIWVVLIQRLRSILGDSFVWGLTTQKGWFSLSRASPRGIQCMGLGKTQPEPLTAYVPPEIPLVSWFPFVFKNTLKHWKSCKMVHIRLEIIYICINKPFRVQFHRINAFPSYFVYLMKNTNTKENAIFQISKYMKYHLYLHQVWLLWVMFISAPLHCNVSMWCCDAIDRNRILHIPSSHL